MTNFQLIRRGNEFPTVPETGSGLHGGEIDEGGDDKNDPSCNPVVFFEVVHALQIKDKVG